MEACITGSNWTKSGHRHTRALVFMAGNSVSQQKQTLPLVFEIFRSALLTIVVAIMKSKPVKNGYVL